MLLRYKHMLTKAKEETDRTEQFVEYWSKIEGLFFKRSNKKVPLFRMKFKHIKKGDVIYDDEFRIGAIADYYGYDIINEELKPTNSVYTFKRR